MSGSNSICVATVLLDSGIIEMQEPITKLTLEAPGGLVHVTAECKDGKAERIRVQNVPAFVGQMGVDLDVPGLGKIKVDTAYGGDTFVVVNADQIGFDLIETEARRLAELGVNITDAANQQLSFNHPENEDWSDFSFCMFAGPLSEKDGELWAKSVVAIQPGKIDRSPTGTAVCARMAILRVLGIMEVGDVLTVSSIIGSEFKGTIIDDAQVGGKPAIVPEVSGRGWITGTHQYLLDPNDPWPEGYRLSDTWPNYK
jgi:proline racemase